MGYASRSSSEDLNSRSPRCAESPETAEDWVEAEEYVVEFSHFCRDAALFDDSKENVEDLDSLDTQLLYCGEERLRLAPVPLKKLDRRALASPTKTIQPGTPNDLALKRFMVIFLILW